MNYDEGKDLLSNINEMYYKISNIERYLKELTLNERKNSNKIEEKIAEMEKYKNPNKFILLENYTIKTKLFHHFVFLIR